MQDNMWMIIKYSFLDSLIILFVHIALPIFYKASLLYVASRALCTNDALSYCGINGCCSNSNDGKAYRKLYDKYVSHTVGY